MITPYERIMITVRFSCGHEGIISEFRTPESESQSRYIRDDYHLCKNCQITRHQTAERRASTPQPENYAIRYMVDGYPMSVELDRRGYWRGRRYEDGKRINKYFGKVDPRPSLGEPLLEVEVNNATTD